ncbi:MAG: DUF362 domain-containing protein [Lachnospiraceae bacterium]|nr:DUF362 domain-containing protein [Lachnospiraceae bacterium]
MASFAIREVRGGLIVFDPRVALVHKTVYKYPSPQSFYRPSIAYPEYKFGSELSAEANEVYDMVREGFRLFGLDEENYGTDRWNPLGTYVKHGDRVLIKPNFVMHQNGSGNGMDCLITHPAVMAPVIDYVLIALGGTGSIIIGDAPIQDCHFDEMLENGGVLPLLEFYHKQGIDISLIDFRNVRRDCVDGVYNNQKNQAVIDDGVLVRLDIGDSAFDGLPESRIRNLRVTNYDPRIMNKHHHDGIHEYKVNRNVLEADVVINMPKPKTHRYGGITAALKNIVGINANKEMLPHHTMGSRDDGGDCYVHKNLHLDEAHFHIDARNSFTSDGKTTEATQEMDQYRKCYERGVKESGEKYWFGGWYGNDTIWRTIADLNKIFYYADKDGKMCDSVQRKIFIVADMICGGDHSGPLAPSPVDAGVIAMGEDPFLFDRTICSVMGFDYSRIPQLSELKYFADGIHKVSEGEREAAIVVSNDHEWNRKNYDEIRENSVHYQAAYGWEPMLGYNDCARLRERICKAAGAYIFGFGMIGKRQAKTLMKWGIKPKAFFDNNPETWGMDFEGIPCISPKEGERERVLIIAVGNIHTINALKIQSKELGYQNILIWNNQTEG